MKHGVEVHTLPDYIDHQHQACLWRGRHGWKETLLIVVSPISDTRRPKPFSVLTYLQSKLVEEVVDEVLDEVDDAHVQVLPRDIVEDDPGRRRRQFVPQSEIFLMAVDGHLKR